MYIKLTRLDNSPIWLNALFIVTIEPRRAGGSIVVPIGDGLDYEVRERPEDVLAMLERPAAAAPGAPAPLPEPVVIPIPAHDALTKTPEDVSAEPVVMTKADAIVLKEPVPAQEPEKEPVPAASAEPEKPVEPDKAQAPDKTPEPDRPAEPEKPVRKKTARRTAAHRGRAKKALAALTDEQLERLKVMMPGSVKKLSNTLVSQFGVQDPEAVVKELEKAGVLEFDQDHVVWK